MSGAVRPADAKHGMFPQPPNKRLKLTGPVLKEWSIRAPCGQAVQGGMPLRQSVSARSLSAVR